METEAIVEHLKQIPLFQPLARDRRGEEELFRVADVARVSTYKKGDTLFHQGQPADRFCLVLEGQVRLRHMDREGVIHEVGYMDPGKTFGETGLFVGDYHDVTADAVEDTKILCFPREEFSSVYHAREYLRKNMNVRESVKRRLGLPKFDWLRDDEWVIFAVRRHIIQFLQGMIPAAVLVLLLFPVFASLLIADGLVFNILTALMGLILLSLLGFIGWHYINWRDDYFVLTTQRVVHIERVWFFKKNFEETLLENVEDISEVQPDLPSNLLDYGTLVLQTAGETVQIDMARVPNPDSLREMIFREIERARAREVLEVHGQVRETLRKRLEVTKSPPQEVEPSLQPTKQINWVKVFFTGIWDYFFPPSWAVSEGGDTILWRRFWFPGFLSYLQILLVLIAVTFGGLFLVISRWGLEGTMVLFFVWLFVEAILFGVILWFVDDWRNDYFQLTPNRIIVVHQKPLLFQEVRREAPLDRIQNISFEVPNALGNFLNYGHVMLETAGSLGTFQLKWVRYPQRIQAEISKRQRQYMRQQREAEARRREEEMLTWFSAYDAMRREQMGMDVPPLVPKGPQES